MKRYVLLLCAMLICFSVPAQKRQATQRKAKTTTVQAAKKRQQPARKQQPAKKRQKKNSGPTISGLKAQKEKLVKDKNANIKRRAELEQGVKRGLENLMMLDTEISRQRKVVDTIRNEISALSGLITELDSQLVVLERELGDRRNRYKKSMRYMHRNRSVQDQLMFVFSADNFNQMYRRMRFNRDYASFQKAQGEAVISKQEQVNQKREELAEAKKQKSRLLARGEHEQKELEGKQTEQQTQVDQLKRQQKTVQTVIEQQQKQEAELNAQIDRLIAEEIAREKARQEAEARKKAAAEAAKKRAEELARKKAAAEAARKENERRIAEAREKEEQARQKAREAASKKEKEEADRLARKAEKERREAERRANADNTARNREIAEAKKAEEDFKTPAADRKLSGSFEANKGRLPVPITGGYKIIRGYGPYTPEGLSRVRLQSNGWHLKGQPGAKARCIFEGEVSGIYNIGGAYTVTVRHGKYISVYINLSSISVQKGQHVATRQQLGSLGSDNTMQFQLRNWSSILNPSRWLGR